MKNEEQSGRVETWLETMGWTGCHRIIEVGRGLLRMSISTPLLKLTLLEQVAQDRVRLGFECLNRQELHDVSGQPVPVFDHW